MPATIGHVLTATTPDDPAYEIRPSHWNSSHAVTLSINATEISPLFSNANGVSFGVDGTNITASVAAGGGITNINVSAGTTSQNLSALTFNNSNGISFGLNGSVITGTVATNYQSQGAYLTTAMASNRGSDFVQATAAFAGTNASGTIGSAGISISVAAPGGGGLTNINVSAGTTSNNLSALTFNNSNGISFGLNGSVITGTVATNYQSQGAYLTTARASNDAIGLNSGLTANGVSVTANSSGLSLNFPAFLTTAMQSNAVTLSNIRVSGGTTSNLLSAITFANLNGVSFGLNAGTMTASHNGLTTARASNDAIGLNSGLTANGVSMTANSSGLSLNFPAFLTTARASNDAVGLNTAQSNVTWTVNSAGLSFNAAGYAGTGLSLTNATATLNSNGLQLSVGGGGVTNQTGPNIAAGGVTVTNGTVEFSNANGVTFGLAGSTMTASHNGLTTAALSDHSHGNPTLALTNLSGTTASASNGLTISLSAAAAGGGAATQSGFNPFERNEFLGIAGFNGSLIMQKLQLPYPMQFDRFCLHMTGSNATNSSGSATISFWAGIYSRNVSSLSLMSSSSMSTAITQSGTVGSYSRHGGMKILPMPWTVTVPAGNYYVGMISRTTTGGANMTFGNLGMYQLNSTWSGFFGSASGATNGRELGVGIYSASTTGMPSAISLTQLNANSSAFNRIPAFQFMSQIL